MGWRGELLTFLNKTPLSSAARRWFSFIARRLTQQTWSSKRRQRSFWIHLCRILTYHSCAYVLPACARVSRPFLTFSAAAVFLCRVALVFNGSLHQLEFSVQAWKDPQAGFKNGKTGALIAAANLVARDWFSCWCRKYIVWILFVATIIRGHWFGKDQKLAYLSCFSAQRDSLQPQTE